MCSKPICQWNKCHCVSSTLDWGILQAGTVSPPCCIPGLSRGPGQRRHGVYWRRPSGTEEARCLILERNQPQTEELTLSQSFLPTSSSLLSSTQANPGSLKDTWAWPCLPWIWSDSDLPWRREMSDHLSKAANLFLTKRRGIFST